MHVAPLIPGETTPGSHGARSRLVRLLGPAVVLVLVALTLRGPFAAVGPVLGRLDEELSLSTGALSVIAALPLVCFGLLSPVAPVIARRLGGHLALLAGMAVLALGVLLRLGGVSGFFVGTVLLSGGIAVINVLLPAVTRAEYGARSAVVIGATTASIAISASTGAGLAQPLAAASGSARIGLTLWIVPVLVALIAVAVLAWARRDRSAPAPDDRAVRTGMLRDPVALAVTLFFGLQSLGFFVMLTWLPSVLQSEAGVSPLAAGALLASANALGVPASLVMPFLAARGEGQGWWVLGVSLVTAIALVGLLVAPAAAPVVWTLLYGLGTGASFPLAMTLVLLRTRDFAQTGRLSATSQSVGYLLAAAGPLSIGLLHEATGGWAAGLLVLLAVLALQLLVGLAAARPRFVAATA